MRKIILFLFVILCFGVACANEVYADYKKITDNLFEYDNGIIKAYAYRDYTDRVSVYSKDDFAYLEGSWSYTGSNWYENVLNMFTNNELEQYIKNKVYNKSMWDLAHEGDGPEDENNSEKNKSDKQENSNNKYVMFSDEDIVIAY